MQNAGAGLAEINALEMQAGHAAQSGRDAEAVSLWMRILAIDPVHARTLTALGLHAFRRGDTQGARAAFQRLVDSNGTEPQQWVNLALACRQLKDEPGEEAAIRRALSLDPTELVALLLRADLLERQGRTHHAAMAYGAAATVSPPLERLHADLRPAVAHALKYREQYDRDFAAFMDRYLEAHDDGAGRELKRFRDSLDIMVGRKRRYDSQSVVYHYPQLAPIEFFDRAEFPWLEELEAATDGVRDEFLGALDAEEGFTPYISYPDDVPQNQFAELNNSPRWSAFHLYKLGQRIEDNAAKCPRTMAVISRVPQPDLPGRTPSAMFSLLKPKTRIPPHTGVTNVRLVTHLALIVPEGCRFRVGNDTREWVPGKAWVFDDTIEHEAVNDSDKLRVVLIFDVWHPHLTPPERTMITALMAGVKAFTGDVAGFEP
ncbi:MAG TPA: aspartyl/asparaginyl beta-hydroxylase domain-containing protein [Casimicrobiaceae bacterium]|nr:aspartyl/asparaginyl beta-hydroxylase domain-containing protein [Casimicrobiaceae bacterium]